VQRSLLRPGLRLISWHVYGRALVAIRYEARKQ
jgi:hypothetical protein